MQARSPEGLKIFTKPSHNLAELSTSDWLTVVVPEMYPEFKNLLLLLTFLAVLSGSCGNNNVEPGSKLQYFSLSEFVDEEVARLSKRNPKVFKTVFLNGERQEKDTTIANWENELSAFKEADINKKSFLGRYQVDSTYNGGNLAITYKAQKKNFRTKEMTVVFDGNKNPVRVDALVSSENVLYKSHQSLTYSPRTGYEVNGSQTIRFLEPDSFSVSAIFP